MAKWLRLLTSNPLLLRIRIPPGTFGIFYVRKLSSSLKIVGGSIMPETMHRGAPEVFLRPVKLESHHITFTVLVLHKPK